MGLTRRNVGLAGWNVGLARRAARLTRRAVGLTVPEVSTHRAESVDSPARHPSRAPAGARQAMYEMPNASILRYRDERAMPSIEAALYRFPRAS